MATTTKTAPGRTQGHSCSSCGHTSPRWFGRCPECASWNTAAPSGDRGTEPVIAALGEAGEDLARWPLGIAEVDRVLGGGIVPGGVMLLAGEPGIGKSTLVLQILAALQGSGIGTLLCTGEESLAQISLRAERVGGDAPKLRAMSATALDTVLTGIEHERPGVVVIDSIQTLQDTRLDQAAGSPTQVRETAAALATRAKALGTAVIFVGHVTKDGNVAGPKMLEHMVDVVLALEGERTGSLRMLRSLKNRFGPSDETGVFLMEPSGLEPVGDPSALLLADRCAETPGSVVLPALEGSRPVLLEIQALIAGFDVDHPRRITTGIELRRAELVLGVLAGRGGLRLPRRDVYLAASGGLSVKEPAADLALAAALFSVAHDIPIGHEVVAMGEVGLAGEVRRIPAIERRLKEAERLGFGIALVPPSEAGSPTRMTLIPVRHISDVEGFIVSRGARREPKQSSGVVFSVNRQA